MTFFALLHQSLSSINNPPEFKFLENQDTNDEGDIIVGQKVTFSSTIKTNTYHLSSVKLTKVQSIYNNAFGRTDSEQYGGAFYLTNSRLEVGESELKGQSARSGGVFALISCQAYIYETEFILNNVYRYGGDIFSSGEIGVDGSWIAFKDCTFEQSSAQDVGGSLAIQLLDDLYIQDCNFTSCRAGHAASSVYVSHTDAKFFNTIIYKSNVQNIRDYAAGDKYEIGTNDNQFTGPLVRGAGSLVFYSGAKKSTALVTQECSFINNSINVKTNMGKVDGSQQYGIDVTLIGQVSYISISDSFSSDYTQYGEIRLGRLSVGRKEIVVSKSSIGTKSRDSMSPKYTELDETEDVEILPHLNFFSSSIVPGNDPNPEVNEQKFATPKTDDITMMTQSVVVVPTNLPNLPLPPTHFPFATTRSHKYPMMQTFIVTRHKTLSMMATPSVTATPGYTPFPTPSASPSPSSSPSSSLSPSDSPTASQSWNIQFPTPTPHPTLTATASRSVSATPSPSKSASRSISATLSKSPYPTRPIASPSASPSIVTVSATRSRIPTPTEMEESEKAEQGIIPGISNSVFYIILGGIGAVLLIIAVGVFLICFVFRSPADSSSASSIEMVEETILNYPETMASMITQDNPLWTTSVIGTDDDPFRNDFEETTNSNIFFRASKYDLD